MKRLALRLSITAVFLACGVIAIAQSLKKKETTEGTNQPGGVVSAPGVLPDTESGTLIPPKIDPADVELAGGPSAKLRAAKVSPAAASLSQTGSRFGGTISDGSKPTAQPAYGQTSYGQTGAGQTGAGYGQTNAGQTGAGYGQTGAGQTGAGYGQMGAGQASYGQAGNGSAAGVQTQYGQTGAAQTSYGQTAQAKDEQTVTGYGQSSGGATSKITIGDQKSESEPAAGKATYGLSDASQDPAQGSVSKAAGGAISDSTGAAADVPSKSPGGYGARDTDSAQANSAEVTATASDEASTAAAATGAGGQYGAQTGGQYGGQTGGQYGAQSGGQYGAAEGQPTGVQATSQPAYSQQIDAAAPAALPTTAAGTPGDEVLEGAQRPSLTIEKNAPREIQVGTPATFEIVVSNEGRADALDVMVVDQTPQGTRLINTTPPIDQQAEDGSMVWRIGTLKPGDTRTIKIELMPIEENEEIGSVARVLFEAQASVKTRCTKPQLVIEGKGPESVLIGDDAVLEYTIINQGTGAARNVVILEDVPEGFTHTAGRELEYEIGTLRPNERYPIKLKLRAEAAKLGVVNVLKAQGEGQVAAEKQVAIDIVAPQLAIQLQGPRTRYLNRRSKYKAIVANTGTAAARNVDVVVRLPKGVDFVESPDGEYDNRAHVVFWNVKQLDPQKQNTFELTVTPAEIGPQRLSADAQGNLSAKVSSEVETSVDGLSELTFNVSDVADPIEFGEETTYEIVIQNIGTKSDTNIKLVALLPPGLQFKSAKGSTRNLAPQAAQDGQLIQFEPITKIGPNQDAQYRITVTGQVSGDYRIQVQVASDEASTPVTREESTRVLPAESP